MFWWKNNLCYVNQVIESFLMMFILKHPLIDYSFYEENHYYLLSFNICIYTEKIFIPSNDLEKNNGKRRWNSVMGQNLLPLIKKYFVSYVCYFKFLSPFFLFSSMNPKIISLDRYVFLKFLNFPQFSVTKLFKHIPHKMHINTYLSSV